MKIENIRSGSCLCGAVKLKVNSENNDLGVCHCAKCLKWSGGPLMELECGANIEFEGNENIQTYESVSYTHLTLPTIYSV